MKKLLLALCLLPSIAFAYTPTYGCFIENYQYDCSTRDIFCDISGYGDGANLLAFGTAVGHLCNKYEDALAYAVSYSNQRDDCVNQYNTLVPSYNSNLIALNKQKKLVKRLRAACGYKCRPIK